MSWHAVYCFDCGTNYEREFVRFFTREYGEINFCPRCGGDYLLGFPHEDSSMNIEGY